MPVTVDQNADAVVESGLLSREAVQEVLADIGRGPEATVQQFARELVRRKLLTRLQATAVYQGKASKLVVGEYVLQAKLGEGGMGVVYLAEHRRMKRPVAIKILSPAALSQQDSIDRFYREV